MTHSPRRGPASALRAVAAFAFRHWSRQPSLALGIAGAMSLATLTEVFVPYFAGRMIDALSLGAAGREAALDAFIAMSALGLAMVVLRIGAFQMMLGFTLEIMRSAALDAFRRVQRFSTDWHANSFSGSIVRKITRGMWAFDTLNDVTLLALLPSAVVLVGSTAMMATQWPALGLVMGVGSLAYVTLTVALATKVVAPAARLSNQWDTRIGGALADTIGANAVVKAFGAETREETRLAQVVDKWRRRTLRTWRFSNMSGLAQLSLLWMVRTALTGAALWLWWAGAASAGDVVYALTSYLVIHGYLREIGQHVHQLQQSVNEMEELARLHDEPVGVADRADARDIAITRGEIAFEDVTFRYAGHATPLYERLGVTIPGGQRVGLVGRSGSGKTTFVKLIQRLYDVTDGRVTIDGHDVAQATQDTLRGQIAIVPQEPILFHRTLAENIAYARPGAGMAEIERAARLANAHGFIEALPKGYHTLVGERGVKLSGGERQRVALARAFLADAPILILDEATSSLDSESEALIQQAIERLMTGRTAIIVAHRLSTVRAMDRILVFDKGRILEDGPHDKLVRREGGLYRQLFERQDGARRERETAA